MKTRFTWRWVAKQVAIGPLADDIPASAWTGFKMLANAIFVFVVRIVMVLMFPVSVPALVYGFRWAEHRREQNRKARRAAMDADV